MIRLHFIRTDGSEEHVQAEPGSDVFQYLRREIDAESLDTVNLRDGRVMFLDDDGYEVEERVRIMTAREAMEEGFGIRLADPDAILRKVERVAVRNRKPFNEKATALYHAVCKPGTTHQIVGDVCIVFDRDFEE